jgi:hypothetical protein
MQTGLRPRRVGLTFDNWKRVDRIQSPSGTDVSRMVGPSRNRSVLYADVRFKVLVRGAVRSFVHIAFFKRTPLNCGW